VCESTPKDSKEIAAIGPTAAVDAFAPQRSDERSQRAAVGQRTKAFFELLL
jgi:hypothetical protein